MTLKNIFKRIEIQYNAKLPFVTYRKPSDTKIKALFQENDTLHIVKDYTEQGFVFSPFDDSENSILIPLEASEAINEIFTVSEEKINQTDSTSINLDAKNQHINLVNKGVEAIKKDVFKKVVLSREEVVPLLDENPIKIFRNLLNNYPSAFVYCWYHPKVGLWLGATPETLVKIEGSQFSIMALAGTQDYKGTLDVVWQDKEKQEQKFVTDFIIDNLKTLTETVNVSETETVKAGNLIHLKTMISARLKTEAILKDVISVLHPTPAVCGLPKLPAKQFILENENYNRAFYTGFLGELNLNKIVAPRSGRRNIENRAYAVTKKSTQLYVNLRCMQVKNNKAVIYVGGGVTVNSNAELEWKETVSKSLVIKKAL